MGVTMSKQQELAHEFLERNKDNRENLSFAAETHIRNLLNELEKPQTMMFNVDGNHIDVPVKKNPGRRSNDR